MASKKTFKPPAKKADFPRKVAVSLTDEQYADIFNAVINLPQNAINIKSPTMATSPGNLAKSPKESASVENSQSSQKENQKVAPLPAKNTDTSTLSTINSEDFIKNAAFSTPEIKKPKSYREALNSLKALKKNNMLPESLNSSISELIDDAPLSQPAPGLYRRQKLEWLQERRGTGLYVKCDHPNCEKWRYLNVSDPVDVPHQWFCHMNPDPAFNSCSIPEKPIPMYIEDDLIHNCYTAGSIVWAKMVGYPWWPAMVDDCPDAEQYYWINNELYDVPNWYHVVFFDSAEISRKWMLVKDLKSFKHSPDLDKKIKINQIYKKRLAVAKQKANIALQLEVKDRLKQYSFIALWKGELPEYSDSDIEDSDLEESHPNYQKLIKRNIIKRKKALILSQESSSSEKNQNSKPKADKPKTTDKEESNEASVSSSDKIQNRRISLRNSETETKKNIEPPKQPDEKSGKKSQAGIQIRRMSRRNSEAEMNKQNENSIKLEETITSNTLSQESNKTSISSSDGVQTRRMSRRNSEAELNNPIEKPKNAVNKSKTKKNSKKIVARRTTLPAKENLNKSVSHFESEKITTRRKSEVALKEKGRKNAQTHNEVDLEFVKQLTDRCNDLIQEGEVEARNYDKIFQEDVNSSFSSEEIPSRRQTRKSSASSRDGKESSGNNVDENPKKIKINDDIAPSIIKKKKSFVPPVKKSLNTSASSSSKLLAPIFEE